MDNEALLAECLKEIEAATTNEELNVIRAKYLGKNSTLNQTLKALFDDVRKT